MADRLQAHFDLSHPLDRLGHSLGAKMTKNKAITFEKVEKVEIAINREIDVTMCNNEGCSNLGHFVFSLYLTKYLEPRISSELATFFHSGTKFCISIIKEWIRVCKAKANIWIFIITLPVLRLNMSDIHLPYKCDRFMSNVRQMCAKCMARVG